MTQELKTDGTPVEPPSRWEETIRGFEAQDAAGAVPPGRILFVGSSTITRWDLPVYFPDLPLANRGFGGSYLSEVVHFAGRYILPPRPRQIVLYAGDNDLGIGRRPEQVLASFRQFLAIVRPALPDTHVLCISVKPSLLRRHLLDRMRQTNRLLEAECRAASASSAGGTGPRTEFLDIFAPMLDEEGRPRDDLFEEDGLHMDHEGYVLWTGLLRPLLATGP